MNGPPFLPSWVRLVLLAAGLLAALGLSAVGWAQWRGSVAQRHWPQVPGVVLQSELVVVQHRATTQERRTRRWHWRLRYAYTVGGQAYEGQRWSNQPPSADADDGREAPPRLVALQQRHPVGATVAVFYDPAQPAHALLAPAQRPQWWLLAGGVALVTLMAAALTSQLMRHRNRGTAAQLKG